MQRIVPHLWYDREAKEAAKFYTSIFPNSRITQVTQMHDTPSGDAEMVSFDLNGFTLMSISAGPEFKFNPSISFMANFDPAQDPEAASRIDTVWDGLLPGGKVLMPLDAYPFSERYGWVQDKYGLNWQLILTNPEGDKRPFIVPSLMFTDKVYGKAKEASDFYISVFKPSKRGALTLYPGGMDPDKEGTVMFTDFNLLDQWFAAMDTSREHGYAFNEAVSLIIRCEDQAEIDYFWKKLSAVPEAEQCGWLKDKYGVSWQVVPVKMDEMMSKGTPEQVNRIVQAFLPMKKLDLAELEEAFKV